jgi:bifunctional NMN adenylyltransferase/nudix hydrolase
MEIKSDMNPSDYEVGVLIARMQVDELHPGHKGLIDYILAHHKKAILFLGIPTIECTTENPLDYATRATMIRELYPTLEILPIKDQRYDNIWSEKLDEYITMPFGQKTTVLYGSRDSFIPHYVGKYKTIELTESFDYSGSKVRSNVAKLVRKTPDFRAGVIYGIHAKRPPIHSTVDIAVYNASGQILMGRKTNEKLWRFIGGFVDPEDLSDEMAAAREFNEETGGNCVIGDVKYILSQRVDDWRYRKINEGIMTRLFLAPHKFGMAEKSDDIEEVKWVDVKTFSNYDGIRSKVMPEHRDMMTKLINILYSEDLIPNIGERLLERSGNVTYLNE